jgi:hypothetical protein
MLALGQSAGQKASAEAARFLHTDVSIIRTKEMSQTNRRKSYDFRDKMIQEELSL